MYSLDTAAIIVMALNLIVSWSAFQNRARFEDTLLRVGSLNDGQWYRLFSSAFVHVDWTHFFFNMFSLFVFAGKVEGNLGSAFFILIYIGGLLGGNLLAWFYHRANPEYRAVGASGAVSGIIFSAIILEPGMNLYIFLIPFPIPAWIYGLIFIFYSIYGIGRQHDNIGHEAHLGGALSGLALTLILAPFVIQENALTILYLAVPSLAFLIIMFFKPQLLLWNYGNGKQNFTVDDHYRENKSDQEKELNRILEKVKRSGAESLSPEERHFIERHF